VPGLTSWIESFSKRDFIKMDLLEDVLMLSGFGDNKFINRIREMGI
jgi:hypothetical protein